MKSFEYSGVWWLPQNQEHKVAGTVTFVNGDEITLTLEGLLEPHYGRRTATRIAKKYSLILGQTQDGQAITLVDCFEKSVTFNLLDELGGSEICLAMTSYIGAHFTSMEEIRFRTIDVSYSHLPQWAGVFPYQGYQKSFDEVKASTTKGIITVQPASLLKEKPEHRFIDKEALPETVFLHLESQEPLSLEQWMAQFITSLQDLLTLATQRLNTLAGIRAYVQHTNETRLGTTDSTCPIQIIFPETRQPVTPPKPCFPETILFSLSDIADNFSSAMESWLQASIALDSVYVLFFGARYSKLYLDQRFLFIAQAVESYQSRRAEQLEYPEEEHQRLIAILLEACPKPYKKWLKYVLKYSNRATLRKKLTHLVNSTQEILAPLIGTSEQELADFVSSVCDTRNYMTHYDEALKPRAATGEKLFFITQYLSIALQACLLYELGFSSQQCVAMFQKHEVYQFLQQQQPYAE